MRNVQRFAVTKPVQRKIPMKAIRLFKFYFVCMVIFCQVSPIACQIPQSPYFTDEALNGGVTTRYDIYDGPSLWGYINGGADIYLEYGFIKENVQEIRYKESNFKVEIYQMRDVESAYGIYSVSTFRCNESEALNIKHYCETKYQIQFARADSYVSITNDAGTTDASSYNRQLAGQIGNRLEDVIFKVPGLFKQTIFKDYKNDLILIKGDLGLQNGFAFWSDKFVFAGKYSINLLPMKFESGRVNLAILEFQSQEEKAGFLDRNTVDSNQNKKGKLKKAGTGEGYWWNYGSNKIIILESTSSKQSAGKYIEVIEEFLGK